MVIKTQIADKQTEIKKHIYYLMTWVKDRLEAKYKPTDLDYQYPFELKLDELPYFSLYVNLKKAVYENFIRLCQERNVLEEEDIELLSKHGILVSGKLKFKSLKDFESNPAPYVALNIEEWNNYLEILEEVLLWAEICTVPVHALYIKLDSFGAMKFHTVSETGEIDGDPVLCHNEDNDSYYLDKDNLYDHQYPNDWAIGSQEDIGDWHEDYLEVFYPYAEEIGRAYLEAKGFTNFIQPSQSPRLRLLKGLKIEDEDIRLDRTFVLSVTNEGQYRKICETFDTVVDTISAPSYDIPDETILAILEQTLAGMKRIVFAKQLKEYSNSKVLFKGEFTKALGCGSQKFTDYTAIYGDKAFTEDEIKAALKKLGKPESLFEI